MTSKPQAKPRIPWFVGALLGVAALEGLAALLRYLATHGPF
ncbi:MAG: hypothetical protein U1E83_00330 [Methylotetracoccus sp.]